MKILKEEFYKFNKPIIDMWDNEDDERWNSLVSDDELPKESIEEQMYRFNKPIIDMWDNEDDERWNNC